MHAPDGWGTAATADMGLAWKAGLGRVAARSTGPTEFLARPCVCCWCTWRLLGVLAVATSFPCLPGLASVLPGHPVSGGVVGSPLAGPLPPGMPSAVSPLLHVSVTTPRSCNSPPRLSLHTLVVVYPFMPPTAVGALAGVCCSFVVRCMSVLRPLTRCLAAPPVIMFRY